MMKQKNDILDIWANAENQQKKRNTKALIIQPGAIGDCVLTLPLAELIKQKLDVGTIEFLGKSPYLSYLVGRSCIDRVRDMDSVDMHRLFCSPDEFEPDEKDPLLSVFADYKVIINFLDTPGSHFEQNLIFAANCSNPVEVLTLSTRPKQNTKNHITQIHADKLAQIFHLDKVQIDKNKSYINTLASDKRQSQNLLSKTVPANHKKNILIHPGSGSTEKCWHLDNFYSIAETLIEKNFQPIFLIGPAESERFTPSDIDRITAIAPLIDSIDLNQICMLLSNAELFLGNDTGTAHIAAAMGKPVIACFGPTDPEIYTPIGPGVKVIKLEKSDFTNPAPEKADKIAQQISKMLTP